MNLVDVIEMLCDWLTGSENTGTPVERSLEINEKRYNVSPQLMNLLRNTIRDFDPRVGADNRCANPDRQEKLLELYKELGREVRQL